ncbi:aldo/keto reductase [Sphingobacterium kitahiroshimense]|uniref:aldo/keto reductase n=1 Tax=Sphingobacterium kitahiroshimense TaxID=470446 RepID=UPI003208DAA2
MEQNNRRDFLKKGAFIGTSLLATSSLGLVGCNRSSEKENQSNKSKMNLSSEKRTLGRGKQSLEVSALGLGCMGMSYHRSFIPDRKAMIDLLRRSPELGLNFYDTAEAYGPLFNEELVGEALAPFRKDIIIATNLVLKMVNRLKVSIVIQIVLKQLSNIH